MGPLMGLASARGFFEKSYAWEDKSYEVLFVAHADEKGRCLYLARYPGDRFSAPFPIKEVLKDAIEFGSKMVILAHNHPSGDPTPSQADMRSTQRLATTAKALDCCVVEHLILAGEKCTSFRALGLL